MRAILSIDTLRSERSTPLKYVRLIPHSCARASWLKPRAARSRRIFLATISRRGPLCVRFTAHMVRIDAFKATAFKLHNASRQGISPEEPTSPIGQMSNGTTTVEAFLEVAGKVIGATGPICYRAGYRCVETGEIVCAIEIQSWSRLSEQRFPRR
jgi:hypothetical protein